MAPRRHQYRTHLEWRGEPGTTAYDSYSRDHRIQAPGKPDLLLSSDASFRGDASRYNPEDLLVASLSSCHMLWYLHLCARAGIVVVAYSDEAEGTLVEDAKTGGKFERVVLHPSVTIERGETAKALELHHEAHRLCFVANSVNFPVECVPTITVAQKAVAASQESR